MSNPNLRNSLVKLGVSLLGSWEVDWLYNLGSYVDYKNPDNTLSVKSKVDHLAGGLSIVYLFAIFESYFDKDHWQTYIEPDDLKLLRAYRHVRHCVAHGHDGKRVQPLSSSPTALSRIESDAFDEVIQSDLFSPKNIITLDANDKLTINPAIGIHLRTFMGRIAQYSLAKVAS